MAQSPAIPVYLRVGNGREFHVGDLIPDDEPVVSMPTLLRAMADEIERPAVQEENPRMAKTVESSDPNANIRDNTPALDRARAANGPRVTEGHTAFRPAQHDQAPRPGTPPLSDDMRDADNDGGWSGRPTSSMPGMPGPLPGGR